MTEQLKLTDYEMAKQLWRVTPGDWDTRFERVARVFGPTLADDVGRDVE